MSLLYKALNQASQLREKGSIKPDAGSAPRSGAAPATALPLAERLMAQGFSPREGKGGVLRIARLALFGLVGVSAAAIAIALILPAAPPEQIVAPQLPPAAEPPPANVQEAAAPIRAEPVQQTAPTGAAPEPSIAEAADSLAEALDAETPEPGTAPPAMAPPAALTPATEAGPARIGATPEPAESKPGQKRIRDGGLENFVAEQVARESLSGLRPPINIDRTGDTANIGKRSPVEISDDTEIVREKYESAAIMLQRDQPEEALLIYNQLLRNNPRDRISLLGRAAALQKLGRNLMAVSAYEDVLSAFPGDEWALVNLLGLVSAQEPGRALAQLERLQRLNPTAALLPAQIGMIQMAQGNFEMAARSLEKATSLDPENAKYVFNLAVLYDKWGQSQSALRYYRRCLEMALHNPDGQIPMETVRQRMAFLDVK